MHCEQYEIYPHSCTTIALESSNRPLFPQWSHHVYPQFLPPGTHPNHQTPQVVVQQQHHQHFHQMQQQQQQQQQQQHHHISSNANNNYINSNSSNMMNAVNNSSPILHNSHIINNNHQHLHQSNMNFGSNGGQMLNNDLQNATYYQQQHQFIQQQQRDGTVMINNSIVGHVGHPTNGISQHMKNRSRIMKNNGLNNNFYRSSGTRKKSCLMSVDLPLFTFYISVPNFIV